MCRVKFGLTGIYFDSLEPSRPREDIFQPLTASVPLVLQNKQGEAVPEAMNGGENKEGWVIAAEIPNSDQDRTTKDLSYSSSSSSRDEGCRLSKTAKRNDALVGIKQLRISEPSSSSSASSLSASPPPSSDEERFQKVANRETDLRAPKPSKLINSQTTQKRNRKPYNCPTSTSLGRLNKAPPAKSVRFAMDVQESITLSHDAGGMSSSNSSDDSYTDPPSPTEPYDAFGGYYRTTGASRSRNTNGQIVEWGMRSPAVVETDLDGYDDFDGFDGFHDSEDGSEVDVQALPVRKRPPRTVQATAKGLTSDQQHQQNNSIPAAWSKHSGRITDPSRPVAGDLESKVDNGLHLGEAHASQKQPVAPPKSREQSGYPKQRSGKDLPEPIFVVRPKFLSDAKKKRKPARRLSNSGYGKDHLKDVSEANKTPPLRPTQIGARTRTKTSITVSEGLKRDAGFD